MLAAAAAAATIASQPLAGSVSEIEAPLTCVQEALRRLPPLETIRDARRDDRFDAGLNPGLHAGLDTFEVPLALAEGRWDNHGELIQIAPDPPDPWWQDPFGRYSYRGSGNPSSLQWIPGSGNRMGVLTIPFDSLKQPQEGKTSFSLEGTWHLVGGPVQTDMPPHLWDFAARLGRRDQLDSFWSYDLALRTGWFSDFKGSARKGLRFPGHGMVYYTPSDQFQLQVGLDYLDRDDIAVLPVFGAAFKPHPDLRLDAVFPRPRVAYRVEGSRWLYLAGEMEGGTWAIRRADGANDVATYRDYRISLGMQRIDRADSLEIGFVFGRYLEYRSGTPSYAPLNTTILRHVVCY